MTRLDDRAYAFEAVQGIFEQSLPETVAKTFDYTKNCMGLISRPQAAPDGIPEKPWERLIKYIEHLQAVAPEGTYYKLIINGRHGQGYHNVSEAKHGTPAWDEHHSKLDEFFDSHLTPLGEQQALTANAFIRDQIANQGLPAPQSYIVSPLYRCLQTAYLTYSGIDLPVDRPFRPLVKEMIREMLGVHTCDRRSTLTELRQAWPEARFEEGFVEDDVLWQADHRETHAELDRRTQALLDDVFEHDPSTVISFTSHSGATNSLLRVLGHRPFRPETGSIIPLVVKGIRLSQPNKS